MSPNDCCRVEEKLGTVPTTLVRGDRDIKPAWTFFPVDRSRNVYIHISRQERRPEGFAAHCHDNAPNDLSAATTMPRPPLPPELLDHIVDDLSPARDALKNCCLVSKLWIPRARKHLFADVEFRTAANLQSWKNTFKDPSTSPAHYAKSLLVKFPRSVTAADVEDGGWIPTFSRVLHLDLDLGGITTREFNGARRLPLHGFSSALKSLRLHFNALPPSQISDLIDSFPLLMNLSVSNLIRLPGNKDRRALVWKSIAAEHSSLPPFTGSLDLCLGGGMGPIVLRLLSLPGGLHFRKLHPQRNHVDDTPSTKKLIESCSSTVESLEIHCRYPGTPALRLYLCGLLTVSRS